jgi:hypothetical protein
MEAPCFMKNGSVSPVCGIHGVVLERRDFPLDAHAALGRIECLVCPVSNKVVSDPQKPE